MLAPGDTRYYLPLVKQSEDKARSASFYIKPGYKMFVYIDSGNDRTVYLEKGEYDHQLKWPMPEMEIELSTRENIILYGETICTRCGLTVNRLEGDNTEQDINPLLRAIHALYSVRNEVLFVFLTVKKHFCTKLGLP